MPKWIVKLRDEEQFQTCCQRLQTERNRYKPFSRLNAVSLDVDDNQTIESLIDADMIERVDEDITVSLIQGERTETSSSTDEVPWGMERIGAKYQRIPKRYRRPRIAILDTGLSLHPALKIGRPYTNVSAEKSARDLDGHGTHIGGTVAGFSSSQHSFHGVYPGLPLYSVKAFSKDGSAPLSSIIEALEWCIEQKMNIVNMSFGVSQHNPALHEAIRLANDEGLILVAASGNDGQPGLKYPARYPEVISVGAIDREDQVASFSQFGTSLDVVAPGTDIFSTWIGKKYETHSGTSMACAHVTGTMALMLTVNPELNHTQARDILIQSCEPLVTSRLLQGNGLISVQNIVDQLRS